MKIAVFGTGGVGRTLAGLGVSNFCPDRYAELAGTASSVLGCARFGLGGVAVPLAAESVPATDGE
ncbi:hypothetical protein PACID_21500 [Acidipropionibacterium acidipropionici ATCC 4875]|uniref:Uncharacterized protein n=1 Tax=Acidipropionibacterium acidipropionici (strain ATCC 4875 / DSM 20272 / JCM 6432 / NBRC 12425 / NCIMB 8070 / 4) TaxID=1171373 RepID=K7RU73_ACIA4|nr:hypothetical protein [Acidipropionibacterium acidipropionici]AFV89936.1 hypothetical protein PACID_21500 [Acidipropionibacterium acidipropionici ATCC 4875]